MTFSDDFITVGEGQELQSSDNSPSLFGIKLTPQVIGIVAAVALVSLAGYLASSYVMPQWQKYSELTTDRDLKKSQIAQKQENIKQGEKLKTDLVQAKQQQTEILSLFANESTLDTLLLDINRLVESGNASTGGVVSKLQKFEPVNQSAEIINDSSFGSEVNGKLKRRIISISLAGNYEQTQSIFRNMERLQPLLIVNDYNSTLQQDPIDPVTGRLPPAAINTEFKLQVLIPATPEESAAAAAAAAAATKAK